MPRSARVLVLLSPAALLAATLSPAALAPADRVVLKSGRELVGRVEGERDHRVEFVDDERGRVVLPRSSIRTLVRADEPPGLFAPIVLDPSEEPAPRSYVRFEAPRDGEPGRLATAVARFFHERTRTTLFLVGAVHIGEPAYYARLQDVLDSCDTVLYEGVGRRGNGDAPSSEELESMDALTKLQYTLNDALGLQFQRDGLDYRRSYWRNADVDYSALSTRMQEEGVGLPTDSPLFRSLLSFVTGALDLKTVAEHPVMRKMLRRQAASAIGMSDSLFEMGELQKLGEVLVHWRNDAALAVLDEELETGRKGRWIAIFYGAAHLPDMARKLVGRGFEFERSDWIGAWTIE